MNQALTNGGNVLGLLHDEAQRAFAHQDDHEEHLQVGLDDSFTDGRSSEECGEGNL